MEAITRPFYLVLGSNERLVLGQRRKTMITTQKTAELTKKFGGSEKNTGAIEVQVAILTERIKNLTPHFEKNKKDHSGMRGLMKMIGQRRSLLKHLSITDEARYNKLLKELDLRK
jgi:small subunit ribosomal protein S15